MDAKNLLTNKSLCVLPWTGFQLETNGDVKNCIISKETLGNIQTNNIKEIVTGTKNTNLKNEMLGDRKPKNCEGCYLQEKGRKNLSSISSRLYYNREIGQNTNLSLLDNPKGFDLKHVDLRWTNQCNQACVYCGPAYSSKWAKELNTEVRLDKSAKEEIKKFVFDNIDNLQNVYLAGGEPLLMNENKELLERLLISNPEVNIRVNTNLSSTKTAVFDLLKKFKNVHWTISTEATHSQYEYIRHHGEWKVFEDNLKIIQGLQHKISFNMLFFMLNYRTIFDTIEHFRSLGFHENSFIIGPLYEPKYLNVLNLPANLLIDIKQKLKNKITSSSHYLKNSYENILSYIENTKWQSDINAFRKNIKTMDVRRNLSWETVFPEVAEDLMDV